MATVKDLDARLDDQDQAFAEFKAEVREFRAEVRTLVMLGKWLAAFAATTIVSIAFLAGSALYSAGKIAGTQEAQAKELGKLSDRIDKQTERIDRLTQAVDELKTEVRKDRATK